MKKPPTVLVFSKRPLLVQGGIGFSEKQFSIYIGDHMDERETLITVWHEMLHFIMINGKHPLQSGNITILENTVEAWAERLADAFPEIVELVGLK